MSFGAAQSSLILDESTGVAVNVVIWSGGTPDCPLVLEDCAPSPTALTADIVYEYVVFGVTLESEYVKVGAVTVATSEPSL